MYLIQNKFFLLPDIKLEDLWLDCLKEDEEQLQQQEKEQEEQQQQHQQHQQQQQQHQHYHYKDEDAEDFRSGKRSAQYDELMDFH